MHTCPPAALAVSITISIRAVASTLKLTCERSHDGAEGVGRAGVARRRAKGVGGVALVALPAKRQRAVRKRPVVSCVCVLVLTRVLEGAACGSCVHVWCEACSRPQAGKMRLPQWHSLPGSRPAQHTHPGGQMLHTHAHTHTRKHAHTQLSSPPGSVTKRSPGRADAARERRLLRHGALWARAAADNHLPLAARARALLAAAAAEERHRQRLDRCCDVHCLVVGARRLRDSACRVVVCGWYFTGR